jgi:hypothetical protein
LDVGERILQDITLRAKVECGLAGILDLSNNSQDDRMESFVLSETLKVSRAMVNFIRLIASSILFYYSMKIIHYTTTIQTRFSQLKDTWFT